MKTKDEIRGEMRRLRRALTPEERAEMSEAVCRAVLARPDVAAALAARRPFAVYLATPDEIDLTALVEALWAEDVTVAIPCWDAARKRYVLGAYDNTTTLVEGYMHIPEPAEVNEIASADIGVWLVPGLAFTRDGARLGYGGGWYDRLLRDAGAGSVRLGVAYPFQIVGELPVELHDQGLTDIVTLPEE